jgi:hypothetical protein
MEWVLGSLVCLNYYFSLLTLGGYHEYFGESVDLEAMVYLMLVGLRSLFRGADFPGE